MARIFDNFPSSYVFPRFSIRYCSILLFRFLCFTPLAIQALRLRHLELRRIQLLYWFIIKAHLFYLFYIDSCALHARARIQSSYRQLFNLLIYYKGVVLWIKLWIICGQVPFCERSFVLFHKYRETLHNSFLYGRTHVYRARRKIS